MGYSNYWTTKQKVEDTAWDKYCKACKAIVDNFPEAICGVNGTGNPEFTNEFVGLNGSEKLGDDFESFMIEKNGGTWEFCKTGQRPYDAVVVACLMIGIKLGILESWSSDGDEALGEFDEAKELLKVSGY